MKTVKHRVWDGEKMIYNTIVLPGMLVSDIADVNGVFVSEGDLVVTDIDGDDVGEVIYDEYGFSVKYHETDVDRMEVIALASCSMVKVVGNTYEGEVPND